MYKGYKDKILKLKETGKTYKEISEELGCTKSTVAYHCGTEQKNKARARYLLNKEKIHGMKLSQRKYLLEFSWRYKKLCGCKMCGIKDPRVLDYDHINRKDKETTVSQMITHRFSIENIKNEIRKCQVLCANCHRIKTHTELNYFKI